jgi:hypothetical protein
MEFQEETNQNPLTTFLRMPSIEYILFHSIAYYIIYPRYFSYPAPTEEYSQNLLYI